MDSRSGALAREEGREGGRLTRVKRIFVSGASKEQIQLQETASGMTPKGGAYSELDG